MKTFIASVAGIAILFWLFIYLGWFPNYSEGERTGDIYKFSEKGIFNKSWEGSMYLGGYHSTGGDNPSIVTDQFYFSIPSRDAAQKQEIISQIKECARERTQCTIHYRQWFKSPFYISSRYEVIGVEKDK